MFIVILSITAMLGTSFILWSTPSEGQEPKGTNKIGFINLKKIFRDYKKVKDMEQEINKEMESELEKLKAIEEERKKLKEEIPLYRQGSKVRKNKEEVLAEKTFEIKHKKDKAEYFFREKMRMGIEKIYEEITDEVENYAKKENFFMIIRVSDADFFGTSSEEALRMQINIRDILFWDKKNDITDNILEQMDKKYSPGK
jgi:Skp family chaperone for outer membrane proteins